MTIFGGAIVEDCEIKGIETKSEVISLRGVDPGELFSLVDCQVSAKDNRGIGFAFINIIHAILSDPRNFLFYDDDDDDDDDIEDILNGDIR